MTAPFKIGCHLSSAGGYLAMGRTAESIGANVFQFFTRNPRGGASKPIDPEDVKEFRSYAEKVGIGPILAHAPYTLNAAGSDPRVREFAEETMADDLARLEWTPGALYNFHPGSHVGQGAETGIELIAAMLSRILSKKNFATTVLLETMAGKGSEVGRSFEEVRAIIDAGLDRLKAIHLNDSMNALAAHKDRHAQIGKGKIGLEALVRVINHPRLRDLPFYLETPCDLDGYRREIELLRGKAETPHRRTS